MSLRLKINLIVGSLALLFVAALIFLQVRGIREAVREEVVAANRVASQLLKHAASLEMFDDTRLLLAHLERVGRVRSNEITLYGDAGSVLYRSPASTYKSGRDAPAWFSELISPPPLVQIIRLNGGTLEVRSNPSRAAVDAWDDVLVSAVSALALVTTLCLLVFWLVGWAVRPLAHIVHALDKLKAGDFEVKLPPLPGHEAAAIGAAFNKMAKMLTGHVDAERRAACAELQLADRRELGRWMDQHVEQERRLIARELHDELGQSVTAMRSMALFVSGRVKLLDPQAETAAQLIAQEASRLYDAMHGIIPRLTPLVFDNFGLADALDGLVDRTRLAHPGVQVKAQIELGAAPIDADAALALYRAAQEGITNAITHGPADCLLLRVHRTETLVTLDLVDNGNGPTPDWSTRSGHYGLRWIRERSEALGGKLSLHAVVPNGVHLQVRLPLSPAASRTTTGRSVETTRRAAKDLAHDTP